MGETANETGDRSSPSGRARGHFPIDGHRRGMCPNIFCLTRPLLRVHPPPSAKETEDKEVETTVSARSSSIFNHDSGVKKRVFTKYSQKFMYMHVQAGFEYMNRPCVVSPTAQREKSSPERMAPGTSCSRLSLLLLASPFCGAEAFALSRTLHVGHPKRERAGVAGSSGGSGRGDGRRTRPAGWTRLAVEMNAAEAAAEMVGAHCMVPRCCGCVSTLSAYSSSLLHTTLVAPHMST